MLMAQDNEKSDIGNVKDHLANERTFLAWIRTSIAIMAFGFVVEKFSLFLKKIFFFLENPLAKNTQSHLPLLESHTALFGILLVGTGAIICLLAFIKYKRVEGQIRRNQYAPNIILEIMLTLIVLSVALFLMIYLINNTY